MRYVIILIKHSDSFLRNNSSLKKWIFFFLANLYTRETERRNQKMDWKEWIEGYWKIIAILIGFFFCCLLLFSLLLKDKKEPEKEHSFDDILEEIVQEEPEEPEETDNKETTEDEPINIMVDIKGAVNEPGVYKVEKDQRLTDVIEIAGGFTKKADTRTVNLAQVLTDQMMIYIPEEGEELPEALQNSQTTVQTENSENNTLININTAEMVELTKLKGIGMARAQSIVTYREENGRFQTIDEIKQVSGIGEGIFEGIKDEIVVD